MRSVMKHSFAEVPSAEIPRSSFDRSYGHKTTIDAGLLIPFFVEEALPGDTFNLRTQGFCRLATPIFPVLDNMHMETFYFSVPVRILWDNWKKMMGEQTDPGDSTDFLVPTITAPVDGFGTNSLADYFGMPTKVDVTVSALYSRAYNLIWSEWFRDQNLQTTVGGQKDDGPDDPINLQIVARRGKRHDYFTSALPFPQKGPDVLLPLGDTAPVLGIGTAQATWNNVPQSSIRVSDGTLDTFDNSQRIGTIDAVYFVERGAGTDSDGYPNIRADLSNATSATINELREAFQVQKMFERDARSGTRYIEVILAHFKVASPDMRQQRPEYLGGGHTMVNVSPIHSSAETLETAPDTGAHLGRLSGVGTAAFQGHGFTKSFTEHCIVIGLVNVRADITYQQGLNRMFTRRDRFDFFWPALSHLGEQAITNSEIMHQGTPDDDLVFGYQERFAEYRYRPSQISGVFRSNSENQSQESNTLDAWHLSQDFQTLPALNSDFIEDNPPIDRVIAVPTEPHFICDFYHKFICARPMPLFGVPGNIDRF